MFCFSFVAILLTLSFMNTGLDWVKILVFSFLLSLVATFLEAVALVGLDNVTVPIFTSFTLWAFINWQVDIPMLLGGLIISTLIGIYAYRKRALSLSGVLGAIITGTIIYGFGGWVMGLTLIAFFIYSTLLSKYKERQKNEVAADKFDKGSRRDFGQAMANGGMGAVLALFFFLNPTQGWLFAAFIGAMATVNADTWATEIGVLSKIPPRLILNGRRVTPGTSGGVTPLGTSASLVGGLLIGITVWVLYGLLGLRGTGSTNFVGYWWVVLSGLLGGIAGSLFDSLLGATVQAMYFNPQTNKETEKKVARNGVKNEFKRGLRFMDNDLVNFLSSLFGAAIGALVAIPFI
jgi:uncharacterized protein (TIGR00297 family)